MIDCRDDEPVSVPEIARRCPAIDGKRVTPSCIFRWIQLGVRAGDERIRLRHLRIGRRVAVKPSDLEKFFSDLADAHLQQGQRKTDEQKPNVHSKRTDRQRKRDIEAARRDLNKDHMELISSQSGEAWTHEQKKERGST